MNGNFIFFLTRKTVFSKKTALSCIFLELVLTTWGLICVSYSIINSVPGLGFILSLTILYEIDDIHRFSDVGKFISYCRLVKCSHESAGKKEKGGHNKIGNVHLKWAFSEGAVLFLRNNERGQRWHDKLVQRYGKAKAMSIIAQKLGRTVYYMLKRKEAFNPDKFYGDKKIENKDSGGEHLA